MKKLLLGLLLGVIALGSLSGCGDSDPEGTATPEATASAAS